MAEPRFAKLLTAANPDGLPSGVIFFDRAPSQGEVGIRSVQGCVYPDLLTLVELLCGAHPY